MAADAITYTKCSFHDIYVQICPLLCVLLYADALCAADEEDPTLWPKLIEWGVDKIFTDYPDELCELVSNS